MESTTLQQDPVTPPHPRVLGWVGTAALAMGGSNQMIFLRGVDSSSSGRTKNTSIAMALGGRLVAARNKPKAVSAPCP